jgi:ABC-type antimicrobial peptide transport system permease subunit
MALGARPARILRLLVIESLQLVAAGLGLGLLGAIVLTRVLGSLLFDVAPRDPIVLIVGALLLCGVALAAACLPARRASRIDPVVCLRNL